jgi:dihydroorotase
MSRPVLIMGGRLLDPSQELDGPGELLIRDGRIEACGPGIVGPDDAEVVDVDGLVVAPGFIDVHVHFREPGDEHKETIESGARAAAAGGFTTVWTMPNTDPPIDDQGEQMTEVGELVAAGAVAVSDDGNPIWNAGLLRRLLEYTQTFGIPVLQHAEDKELSCGGVMNEGKVATALGLTGVPNAAESGMVARDCCIAELTGGHLHVCHVSTREAVEQVRRAKERGAHVTAEVTPHHLALTEDAVRGYRTEAKMNPPLRTEEDRESLLVALVDGTIDVIATDHAPHHYEEKEREFDDAPFGVVGLETALGVAMRELVESGRLSLGGVVDRLSCAPARIMGLNVGTLRPGARGDIVVFDPAGRWTVDASTFVSGSRNTPFVQKELVGRVRATWVDGKRRYELPKEASPVREGAPPYVGQGSV